jgi:hypothetical protein
LGFPAAIWAATVADDSASAHSDTTTIKRPQGIWVFFIFVSFLTFIAIAFFWPETFIGSYRVIRVKPLDLTKKMTVHINRCSLALHQGYSRLLARLQSEEPHPQLWQQRF